MRRYQRILVHIDIDRHDADLLRYAAFVARMAESEQVDFVHTVWAPVPEDDAYGGGEMPRPVSELQAELEQAVERHFDGPPAARVRCLVEEGVPLDELLDLTRTLESDLVLVGRDVGGGGFAEKLARKAPCSVLILPPGAPPALRRVMVPVDFSEHAADAVDVAVAFAEAAGLDELHLLHVYGLPAKAGPRHEVSTYALRQQAEAAYQEFLPQLDLRGLEVTPHFVVGEEVPEVIGVTGRRHEVDLMVIGTRGRSPGAAVLMGSVAEQVVRHLGTPVIAVKRKGVTLRLLDALLERSATRRSPA